MIDKGRENLLAFGQMVSSLFDKSQWNSYRVIHILLYFNSNSSNQIKSQIERMERMQRMKWQTPASKQVKQSMRNSKKETDKEREKEKVPPFLCYMNHFRNIQCAIIAKVG